ncbi:hypothetical protein RvY_03599 [Ramazzottius varieornatus]|uniref:Uncharacterized protein n=1 Tax=Ramazzottius varieornatus TaxID=947166 RepID=A0A1D1USB8_RAMVA|nr:hypothetical protein RvY_03599 [Ramazzottius varieornatus]
MFLCVGSLEDRLESRSVVSRSVLHAQSFRATQSRFPDVTNGSPGRTPKSGAWTSSRNEKHGQSLSPSHVQGQIFDEQTAFLQPQ